MTVPGMPTLKRYYTAREVAVIAYRAGFRGATVVDATAVALAESGGDRMSRCYNTGSGCGAAPGISVDRCLWQINDRAHPWSTHVNIDDPMVCARAAYRISRGGKDWGPWSTWHHRAGTRFRKLLRRATVAARGLLD